MTQGNVRSNYIIITQPVYYGDDNLQVEWLHVLLLHSKLNVSAIVHSILSDWQNMQLS